MAKIDPRIPNLPSINELLGHPTVRAVVDRLNQSTVAQLATGFLEELREGLLDRTEKGIVPTAEQLAERFARHLLGVKPHRQQIVNATGVVGGSSEILPPLAEPALHQVLYQACEYRLATEPLSQRVVDLLCRLTGAKAAWIAPSFAEAVMACSRLDARVSLAPHAGLVDPQEWGLESVPTMADRLQESDLVVVDGAGLLGGPPCGIVAGKEQTLRQLSMFAGDSHREVDTLCLTALAATLELYQNDLEVIHQIPVLQLLSTPLDNLKQRCERLAPLLELTSAVGEAVPMQCESCWWQTSSKEWQGPSWAISIRFTNESAEAVNNKLTTQVPSVLTRIDNDSLLLDLRSVFPRWDQQLVATLTHSINK